MANGLYFRLDDDKIKITYLHDLHKKMGKPNTYSPIYYMKDNWELIESLTHTLQNVADNYFRRSIP